LKYPKGSEWRKWDLHIHSIHSCEPRTKLSIENIFKAASVNNIAVISITDHSNVDGLDEALDIWESGTDSTGKKFSEIISFFPGVELKATAGKYGVHFLAVFPTEITTQGYKQKIDTAFLKEAFLSKIGCSESDIKGCSGGDYKTGLFKVAVDFKKTAKLVRELGGLIIVHHGNKSNSLDKEISHSRENAPPEKLLNTLGNQKEQLMRECVDICELPNWNTYHQGEKQFYLKTFNKPSVVFSDSHSVYTNSCPTWIKADPTFEGLKQVLNEPDDRICIQYPPQVLEYVRQNKPRYIQSVSIKPAGTEPGWFNDTISLNANLIAIIGNKGTGKSALADIISLLGNTSQFDKFSFLQSKKFRNSKSGKASRFQAEMSWLDDDISGPLTLDENPPLGSVEKVKYLPQNFIDEICNDLPATKDSLFYQELQEVIFSHLQDHERLGCNFLLELLEQVGEETKRQIQSKVDKIVLINADINRLQKQLSSEAKSALENSLAEKKRSVRQIIKDKPLKPAISSESRKVETQKDIIKKIEVLQERVDQLLAIKENYQEQRVDISKKIATADKLSEYLTWLTEKVEEYRDSITKLAKPIGLEPEKLFTVQLNSKPVQIRQNELVAENLDIDKLLGSDEYSIDWELTPLQKDIQATKR